MKRKKSFSIPSLCIPEERGIRLIERPHSVRGTVEVYVETTFGYGQSPKRIYVGTLKTVTQEKINFAYIQAKLLRKDWMSKRCPS